LICGRNKANAEKIIASFPQTPNSKYEFIECDVSLMKNVVATSADIKQRVQTLNYLVLSQGIMTMQGFTPTSEGIDMKLSLHFYSRWKFVQELTPLLEAAKKQGQEVRVMSILDPVHGAAPLVENDMGLKKSYSLSSAAGQAITSNNLMVEEYAKRYPQMSFTHIFPGFVNTPLLSRNSPILGAVVGGLASIFATSLQDCGEYMAYGLLSPKFAKGAFYLDSKAEPVPPKKIITSEATRKLVVDHFAKETATD